MVRQEPRRGPHHDARASWPACSEATQQSPMWCLGRLVACLVVSVAVSPHPGFCPCGTAALIHGQQLCPVSIACTGRLLTCAL